MTIEAIGPYRARFWPEGAVVFDVRLGDTHALNAQLAFAFRAFHGLATAAEDSVLDRDEALAQLAARHLLDRS